MILYNQIRNIIWTLVREYKDTGHIQYEAASTRLELRFAFNFGIQSSRNPSATPLLKPQHSTGS